MNAPRLDIFGPIHRRVRHALASLLAHMSEATFVDAREAQRIVERLESVIELCEEHRTREDAAIPVVSQRLQGTLDFVIAAHAAQPRMVAELRALGTSLLGSPADRRVAAGRTLYLHYSQLVAELLVHMAEEEQVVQPLLERLFTDQELLAVLEQR